MKRKIGLLMMVGLIVGVLGCGDDENPVKSNRDLLVGTWLDLDFIVDDVTFRSDGTFVDFDDDEGTWSLKGDQLTITYDDPENADYNFTFTVVSVTDTELRVTDEDGESIISKRKN